MQSEVAGHIGGKGNHFCRKCEVGGTQKEKATDEGYHALFEAGTLRTKEKVVAELEKQVKLACSGVLKPIKDSQTQTGVKDVYTQHWIDDLLLRFKAMKSEEPDRPNQDIRNELIEWTLNNHDQIYSTFLTTEGFDPTKDTPVEILHTILLGVVKYIWHISHTAWSAEKKKLYAIRLQSTTTDTLSIHAIRANYIMQYAGSLIGRQFKTIAQTNIFHVRGLVTEHQFMAWKAVGELSALLRVPEIRNITEYRLDLKVAVANVLDVFAMIDPSKMITKIKLHLLAHIDEDAVDCGPLMDKEWRRAGSGVLHFIPAHPVLQKLLGWSEEKILKPESTWTRCSSVVGESLDQCFVGSWIFAQSPIVADSTISGRISDILTNDSGTTIVVMETFQVLNARDDTFGMPVLVRRDGETTFTVLPAKNVKFKMNVQHDCYTAKCEATGERLRMQERVQSDQVEHFIVHQPLDHFIINSHAFHNAHLLRATLPRSLLAPIPLYGEDRKQRHDGFAATLRGNWAAKTAKRKAAVGSGKNAGTGKKGKRKAAADSEEGEEDAPAGRSRHKRRRTEPSREPVQATTSLVAGRPKRTIV
ncbi:hypothetical protein C8R46DRAFT_1249143 [Mycena filopes]|nr:hypothetical protein C8R46DRAFT_1249143 [Mycena filopes]